MNQAALRCFAAVADTGSIRAAAELLHLAPSAISRRIMQIERELGVRLLQRQPRGVRLTEAGRLFLRYAREGLTQMARLQSEITDLTQMRSGRLRLAASESAPLDLLARGVLAFLGHYPGIEVEIDIADEVTVSDLVRRGVADLGVAPDLETGGDLRVLTSVSDPLVALMRRRHRMAGLSQIWLADLAGGEYTLPSARTARRRLLDRVAAASGVKLRPVLESDSTPLCADLAIASDAIALAGRSVAQQWQNRADMAVIALRDRLLNRLRMTLFAGAVRPATPAAVALSQQLAAALQNGRS